MKPNRTSREKVIFWLSVGLFAVLNLVPGLTRSYADAQYGGGGGGPCPGTRCTGGNPPTCCTVQVWTCTGPNGSPPCGMITHYYYFP